MKIKFPIQECKTCCKWAASGYMYCWNCMPLPAPGYDQNLKHR